MEEGDDDGVGFACVTAPEEKELSMAEEAEILEDDAGEDVDDVEVSGKLD